jgi:hypothetical protein
MKILATAHQDCFERGRIVDADGMSEGGHLSLVLASGPKFVVGQIPIDGGESSSD